MYVCIYTSPDEVGGESGTTRPFATEMECALASKLARTSAEICSRHLRVSGYPKGFPPTTAWPWFRTLPTPKPQHP